MRRRAVAFVLAVLMVVMLLSTAGHALGHLKHGHSVHHCPVCVVLCAWKKALRMLLAAAMAMATLYTVGRFAARLMPLYAPAFLPLCTPVRLKVKLTS